MLDALQDATLQEIDQKHTYTHVTAHLHNVELSLMLPQIANSYGKQMTLGFCKLLSVWTSISLFFTCSCRSSFFLFESCSVCVCVCCLEGDLKNEEEKAADKSAIRGHLSLQISDEETRIHLRSLENSYVTVWPQHTGATKSGQAPGLHGIMRFHQESEGGSAVITKSLALGQSDLCVNKTPTRFHTLTIMRARTHTHTPQSLVQVSAHPEEPTL